MHFSEIHAYKAIVIRCKRVQFFLIIYLEITFFFSLNHILDYRSLKENWNSFSNNSE